MFDSYAPLLAARIRMRLPDVPPGKERRVIAQDIDRDGREHKDQADPDTPIVVRALPVGIRLMMSALASRRSVLVRAMLLFAHWQRTPAGFAWR